jgi:hypothetical protein
MCSSSAMIRIAVLKQITGKSDTVISVRTMALNPPRSWSNRIPVQSSVADGRYELLA